MLDNKTLLILQTTFYFVDLDYFVLTPSFPRGRWELTQISGRAAPLSSKDAVATIRRKHVARCGRAETLVRNDRYNLVCLGSMRWRGTHWLTKTKGLRVRFEYLGRALHVVQEKSDAGAAGQLLELRAWGFDSSNGLRSSVGYCYHA